MLLVRFLFRGGLVVTESQVGVPACDPLAKDLPGLPLELKNCRLDQAGLHAKAYGRRPEVHIAWKDVIHIGKRQVGLGPLRVVERFTGWWTRAVMVLLSVNREQERSVRSAWREYLLRKAEHQGYLAGAANSTALQGVRMCFLGLPGAFLLVTVKLLWRPFRTIVLRGPPLAAHEPVMLVFLVFLGLLLLQAILLAVASLVALRIMRGWSRWELRSEGLVFWPEDGEKVLSPAVGDMITPRVFVVAEESVEPAFLSHSEVLVPLFVAMAEKGGAEIRAVNWRWASYLADVFVAAFALAVTTWAVSLVDGWGPSLRFIGIRAATIAAIVAVCMSVHHILQKRRLDKLLADGRAMLERLGW